MIFTACSASQKIQEARNLFKYDGNIYLRTIFDTASNKSDFTKDDVFGLVSAEISKF